MKQFDLIQQKIFTAEDIVRRIAQWRFLGKKVAFTNGVFDILHQGHIFSLSEAADEADYLIVGLNSDASTKKLKGENRPINDERSTCIIFVEHMK